MQRWTQRTLLFPLIGLAVSALSVAATPSPQGHENMKVAPMAQKAHDAMARVSQAAARKGMYTCCIAPACGFCALHMGMCPCGRSVSMGKPVCRECKGGWDVGEGRVAGVTASEVKGMSAKQMQGMMGSMGSMGGMKGHAGHRAHH